MAATAEALDYISYAPEFEFPMSFAAEELPWDNLDRLRTKRLVGSVAMLDAAELEFGFSDGNTLDQNIKLGVSGDELADSQVFASCFSDVVERGYKTGMVVPTTLETDESGDIHQFGLPIEDVMVNTLRHVATHPIIRERAVIETHNSYRIKTAYAHGILEDHVIVMLSAVSDRMTLEEAKEENFFTETMTVSIQMATAEEGDLKYYSALVAGVTEPGAERHDFHALDYLAHELGQDHRGLNAEERLDKAFFVHKSLIPEGPISLVQIYDQANGTFFGHEHSGAEPTLQDYKDHVEAGDKLRDGMEETAQRIKKRLYAESQTIKTPLEAIQRLDKISEQELLSRSITDHTIDPIVFGPVAAVHLEQARYWAAQGDISQMQGSWASAQKTANSSSCPGKISRALADSIEQSEATDSSDDDPGDGKGPLKFLCKNGHLNKRPYGGYLKECSKCRDGGDSVGCK